MKVFIKASLSETGLWHRRWDIVARYILCFLSFWCPDNITLDSWNTIGRNVHYTRIFRPKKKSVQGSKHLKCLNDGCICWISASLLYFLPCSISWVMIIKNVNIGYCGGWWAKISLIWQNTCYIQYLLMKFEEIQNYSFHLGKIFNFFWFGLLIIIIILSFYVLTLYGLSFLNPILEKVEIMIIKVRVLHSEELN